MPQPSDKIINNGLNSLLRWIEQNGWSGYDPYDLKAHPQIIRIIRKSKQSLLYTYLREFIFEFFYSFPRFFRKLLRIHPTINPKGIGLITASYLELYCTFKDEKYFHRAQSGFQHLDQEKVTYNSGTGWGYPFDWESTFFIPAGTPNGIVTTAVGEAYWKKYRQSGDPGSLEILINIGRFLVSLPKDVINKDEQCFSYTPLYQNHVHNLNLFVAEFLLKVGLETDNQHWISEANRAINYTLAHQAEDGSFDYNGPPEKPANYIDHYHTGFVLRMLFSVWKLTSNEEVYAALEKGYTFYIEHFFKKGYIPKLKPDRTYRIDIHSCAEAVNCLCTLSEVFPEAREKAEKVLLWTIQNLQDKKGFFYYGILRHRITGFRFKSKIPYFRWGQAWMLKAFASYFVSALKDSERALC